MRWHFCNMSMPTLSAMVQAIFLRDLDARL